MPRLETCPLGHQWETPDPGEQPSGSRGSLCPVCGLEAHSLGATAAEQNTATHTPPSLSNDDVATAQAGTLPNYRHPVESLGGDRPVIPNYELQEVLGRGGMGVVYKARQIKLNRIVALKMILAGRHAGPHELKRFQTEVEAVAKLHHPNIIQIYDVDECEGRPFYTFEYLEGGSLAQKQKENPPTPQQAARLVEILADAIQVAHERGIIHRDLKPGNVLFAADGTPKIADFGLAKRLDAESAQTQSGIILGTPDYMAPEQAGGLNKQISPATDIHALGILLYEQLTGRPPFRMSTPLDTILKVAKEEPIPPSRLQPGIPPDLQTICLKCLEKDPANRYPSARDLAHDLRRFQLGEPIQARRLPVWERTARWARRQRHLAWGLAGGVAMLLFVILIGKVSDKPSKTQDDALVSTVQEEGKALPDDLDLVPQDSFGFVTVHVSDLLKTEAARRVQMRFAFARWITASAACWPSLLSK